MLSIQLSYHLSHSHKDLSPLSIVTYIYRASFSILFNFPFYPFFFHSTGLSISQSIINQINSNSTILYRYSQLKLILMDTHKYGNPSWMPITPINPFGFQSIRQFLYRMPITQATFLLSIIPAIFLWNVNNFS